MPSKRGAEGRIGLCLSSINYPPFFGGAAQRFARYLPGLAERGVDSRVFAGLPLKHNADPAFTDGLSRQDVGLVRPAEVESGVPVHRVVLESVRMRSQLGIYARRLRRFCLEGEHWPDVVHLLNLHKSDLPTLWALRRAGIPVVFSLTMIGKHSPTNPLRRLYQDTLLRVPYRFVDAVVTSTDAMADWLRSYGIKSQIEVIPNGVNVTRFRPEPDSQAPAELRRKLGIGPEEKMVLAVGAVKPRKRTDLLARAWVAQRRLGLRSHLVVAGPLNDSQDPTFRFRNEVQEIVREAGLEKQVHFVGVVDDIADYYRAADLFVLTSEREGMNNAFFEAMASGLPVLTVRFQGLSAAHGRPGTHYELAGDEPEALGRAIDDLLVHEPQRKDLSRQGREWALAEADVERVLDRYAALYRNLAAKRA